MPSDFYWLVGAHPAARPPSTFILSTTSATAPARRKKTATEQVGRLTRWLEHSRSLGAPLVGWSKRTRWASGMLICSNPPVNKPERLP